ncbi:MAG: hypothetical protein ACRC5C_14925, partial [Bacilli bacterium]
MTYLFAIIYHIFPSFEKESGDNFKIDKRMVEEKSRCERRVLGYEAMRDGQFRRAMFWFKAALELESSRVQSFVDLGKASYLAGEGNLAERCFLAAMHLHLSELSERMIHGALPPHLAKTFQQLTEQERRALPCDIAFVLHLDANLSRHMGHCLLDFSANGGEITRYRAVYQASIRNEDTIECVLAQQQLSQMEVKHRDFHDYMPIGRMAFEERIQ